MTDLFDPLPPPANLPTTAASGGGARAARLSVNGKPLGRPPGARNRGSMQLGKYIEATFGGMTPGQQSAELGLVKPADVARARADAEDLVQRGLMRAAVLDMRIPKVELAQIVKAVRLGVALGCDTRDAYLLGQREREGLMAYVHQKQPVAEAKDARQLPTMFVVDRADLEQAQLAAPGAEPEILEDFDLPADQLGQANSDTAT